MVASDRKEYRQQWYQQNKARLRLRDQAKAKQKKGIELTEEEQQSLLRKKNERSNLVEYRVPQTKEEKNAKRREYESRPENRAKRQQYSDDNREALNERSRRYRRENRDEYNAYLRERNKSEKSKAYRRERYQRLKAEGYYEKLKAEGKR